MMPASNPAPPSVAGDTSRFRLTVSVHASTFASFKGKAIFQSRHGGDSIMSFITQLVKVLEEEWKWFGKDLADGTDKKVNGTAKEAVEPFAGRIGDYWLTIPTAEYDDLVKKFAKDLGKLDGTVRKLPWSAAFISYSMQKAGAGSQFPYSAGHAKWIIKSIKNRQSGKTKAALVGFRTNEFPLRVGDLVGAPRESGVTYDNAVAKGWFTSHTDVIAKIDLPNRRAYAIGGNVGQSVARTELRIDANGMLTDTSRAWFVHIRNNIAQLPPGPASLEAPRAG
jgi:hypothetical protein